MANISDVARAAGVSKTTVSYVLSGNPRISKQTVKKVQDAIDDLGYTVNHAARVLSAKKTNTFGIVAPVSHSDYLSALFGLHIYLLSEQAAKIGYDTLFIGCDGNVKPMKDAWRSGKVDGFILMDVRDDDPRLELASKMHVPTVVFGSPKDSLDLDVVDSDFATEAESVIRFLSQEKHEEAIFLLWSQRLFRRKMGFALRFKDSICKSAQSVGMTHHLVSPEDDDTDPTATIEGALRKYPNATAMVIHDEPSTIVAPRIFSGTAQSCARPDFRVITIFPKQLTKSMKIPFASVQTDINELARSAVEMLLKRVSNPDAGPCKRFIDFSDTLFAV